MADGRDRSNEQSARKHLWSSHYFAHRLHTVAFGWVPDYRDNESLIQPNEDLQRSSGKLGMFTQLEGNFFDKPARRWARRIHAK